MTAAEAVITLLKAYAPVTALVNQRVYAVKLPQKPTLPAFRIQRVGEDESMHLRGRAGVRRTRIQVDAVSAEGVTADPVAQATAVDAAAYGRLAGFAGTVGVLQVALIEPVSVREGYDADELRQFKVMRDYYVWVYG